MKTNIASTLAWAEHDFIAGASDLDRLADTLAECGSAVPACYQAARNVRRLAHRVLAELKKLDPHISDYVAVAQNDDEEAPF